MQTAESPSGLLVTYYPHGEVLSPTAVRMADVALPEGIEAVTEAATDIVNVAAEAAVADDVPADETAESGTADEAPAAE